jgi:hypothetical protein
MRAVQLIVPAKLLLYAIAPALMAVDPAVFEIEPKNKRRHQTLELPTTCSDGADHD